MNFFDERSSTIRRRSSAVVVIVVVAAVTMVVATRGLLDEAPSRPVEAVVERFDGTKLEALPVEDGTASRPIPTRPFEERELPRRLLVVGRWDRRPVHGASVVAASRRRREVRPAERFGVTDADGAVALPAVERLANGAKLTITSPGFQAAEVEAPFPGEERVVELEAAAVIEVQVLDDATGSPIRGVAVAASRLAARAPSLEDEIDASEEALPAAAEPWGAHRATTNGDGVARVATTGPGDHAVRLLSKTLATAESIPAIRAPGRVVVRTLTAYVASVIFENDEPVSYEMVNRDRSVILGRGDCMQEVTAKAEERLRAKWPAAIVTVYVPRDPRAEKRFEGTVLLRNAGWAPFEMKSVPLDAFVAPEVRRVEARSPRRPATEVRVEFVGPSGRGTAFRDYMLETKVEGKIRNLHRTDGVYRLPEGRYTIVPLDEIIKGAWDTTTIDVVSGPPMHVRVPLVRDLCRVRIEVNAADGAAVYPHIAIVRQGSRSRAFGGMSSFDAWATRGDDVSVEARAFGFRTATAALRVAADEERLAVTFAP